MFITLWFTKWLSNYTTEIKRTGFLPLAEIYKFRAPSRNSFQRASSAALLCLIQKLLHTITELQVQLNVFGPHFIYFQTLEWIFHTKFIISIKIIFIQYISSYLF